MDMTKRCTICGASISTDDWYSFIRTKYCCRCAYDVRRSQKSAWMREFRQKNREQNSLTRELCSAQQDEIERLRELVAIQRDRVRNLEKEIEVSKYGK